MYVIIQSRWIRGSSQSGENIVGTSTRKREALGLLKQNFNSHLEVLLTHNLYGYDNYEIDEENYSISLGDDYSIAYNMRYYFLTLPDPKEYSVTTDRHRANTELGCLSE